MYSALSPISCESDSMMLFSILSCLLPRGFTFTTHHTYTLPFFSVQRSVALASCEQQRDVALVSAANAVAQLDVAVQAAAEVCV